MTTVKAAPGQDQQRLSLREAIDAKCKACIFDETEPGRWRQQVAACSVTSCPLYPVRPLPRLREN
jgi:hypothetical protein